MAEIITLAKMPKGKPFKTLSIYEKSFIDENYQYEPMQAMANILKIRWIDVDMYCSKMGYEPTKVKRKRPKQIPKDQIFDVENYKTVTI